MQCESCGTYISAYQTHGGSLQRYCSKACKQRAYRRRKNLPSSWSELERFTRCAGKRPIQCDGTAASSTDPTTWSTLDQVFASNAGDGYGIMLGDGLACFDLDHILGAQGKVRHDHAGMIILERLSAQGYLYAEISTSGDGLHIFINSTAPSWKRQGVEFYSHSRFIRLTGRRYKLRR